MNKKAKKPEKAVEPPKKQKPPTPQKTPTWIKIQNERILLSSIVKYHQSVDTLVIILSSGVVASYVLGLEATSLIIGKLDKIFAPVNF